MTWAAIGAAAVTAIGSDISQGPVTAGTPPPPVGIGGQNQGGLLGASPVDPSQGLMQLLGNSNIGGVTDALAQQPVPLPQPTPVPPEVNDDVSSLPGVDQGVLDSLQTPPEQGLLGGFFGRMDNNLQSPSKVIGLGLLNRQDPRLGLAGLLASGLFGGKQ